VAHNNCWPQVTDNYSAPRPEGEIDNKEVVEDQYIGIKREMILVLYRGKCGCECTSCTYKPFKRG